MRNLLIHEISGTNDEGTKEDQNAIIEETNAKNTRDEENKKKKTGNKENGNGNNKDAKDRVHANFIEMKENDPIQRELPTNQSNGKNVEKQKKEGNREQRGQKDDGNKKGDIGKIMDRVEEEAHSDSLPLEIKNRKAIDLFVELNCEQSYHNIQGDDLNQEKLDQQDNEASLESRTQSNNIAQMQNDDENTNKSRF
ncbi:hypothetical protein K7X08_037971 [Anisodus acutangulus]|uniref:Uncharacterized protein n=1 Tax=Anisodus acutangulus TaxID=402998 RepID=A0A9Q1MXH1_9SOLA|nr:hypothetical protein K7X08_037971 [Anisodus acutangulus]